MKNLMITSVLGLNLIFANAQTTSEKQIAEKYVAERVHKFVKGIKPVYVNTTAEIDKIADKLAKSKVSYRKYSIVFNGEINEDNVVGGMINSYTLDLKKKFVYYTVVKEGTYTTVWVVSGHNSI